MERDEYQNNRRRSSNQYNSNRTDQDWDRFYQNIGDEIAGAGDEADFLDEVNRSLASQVNLELGENATTMRRRPTKKKKFKKSVKIFAAVFSAFMLIACLLMFTSPGRKLILNIAGNYIYGKLDYQEPESDVKETIKITKPKEEQHIINILLLGVEEIGGASNTDVMIVATMNTKDKSIKLTSLMRDLYVEIPGYNNNKLNSVYAKEGIDLLYQTIKNNFGITLDGYAKVDFESFEDIVDLLGGVEVTLTANEANYLNRTNYISNPAYRNVVEGTQIFNGNQAVGYARIRYVSTGKEANDFGRTSRHRALLNAIFDKMKTKNIIQLGLTMNKILDQIGIETDITQAEFNTYLEEAASLKVSELQNYRIPSDGNFKNERVPIGSHNQDVLVPLDWEATRQEIRQIIFGDTVTETEAETESTAQ